MNINKLKNGILHIEAEGCIVNIQEGLFDEKKKCTSISIIPDEDYYQDEKIWKLKGHAYNRVIQNDKILE